MHDHRFVMILKVYLENFLIQNPGAEHGDAVSADGSLVTPQEVFGDLLLTVHDDGDRLLLHTDGHTVPPAQSQEKPTLRIKTGRSRSLKFQHPLIFETSF